MGGQQPSIILGNYTSTIVEVEKIEIKTLDKGSSNDDSKGEKEGLVHKNIYELEVVKFKDDKEPDSDSMIQWWYGYTIEAKEIIKPILQNGRKIKIIPTDPDVFGKDVTFYAYISNINTGAKLTVFHHYRFRWFDRKTVEKEVNDRVKEPWNINQASTSLCGMACIFYLMAKQDGAGYKKFVLELHQKGEAEYNGYKIKPGHTFYQDSFFDMNPQSSKYPPRIPQADWISLASTRNSESTGYAYEGRAGENFDAINYPDIMIRLKNKFLAYSDVVDKTYPVSSNLSIFGIGDSLPIYILKDKLDKLIEIQKAWQEGYKISILILSDMLDDKTSYAPNVANLHWITYEGDIWIDEAAGTYTFSYWCWGEKPKKRAFKREVFNTNYYGYIKAK